MALYQVNNFTGNLTRKPIGEMNSGMARIGKTHSVDPFTKPPSLLFNETATNLDPTHATVTDLIVDSVSNEESGTLYEYMVDRSGTVYKVNTSTDAISIVTNTLGITLKLGGGIKILNPNISSQYLMISHDKGVLYMAKDGSNVVIVNNAIGYSVHDTDFNVATDQITVDATSMQTGMPMDFNAGPVPLPSPLAYAVTYYVIVVDSTHIKLATTYANAISNVALNITDTGSSGGTFSFAVNSFLQDIPHPISDEFFGGIFIGNGPYLVDFAIASLIVSHTSRLSPTYPVNYIINSLSVDGEGRYIRINATTGTTQDIITVDPTAPTQAPTSRTIYWNGVDTSYDSYDPFSQTNMSGMFSYLGSDMATGQDFWGASLFQTAGGTVDKMLALREVRAPNSNSITSTGSLLLFAAPYYVQNIWKCGIFAFGMLDDQDAPTIYQLLALDLSDSNTICTAVGMLRLAQNRYIKSDGTNLTNSKFYVSTYETGTTPHANLYSFNLTPGAGTPNDGVYQTQTEYFPMQQQIDRIAFYVNPTQSGVSFKLELVDVDDTIPTGASFTYTYAAGTDETLLAGSLEFFEWGDIQVKNFQAMGLKITNLGTVQPGINQLFIETHDTDKGASQLQQ